MRGISLTRNCGCGKRCERRRNTSTHPLRESDTLNIALDHSSLFDQWGEGKHIKEGNFTVNPIRSSELFGSLCVCDSEYNVVDVWVSQAPVSSVANGHYLSPRDN